MVLCINDIYCYRPNMSANQKLVIPTDEARWQKMKKTLSKGGIYHVVLTDKTEKLCLWNGVDLLLWTDMEIVLEASHIWVGSLKAVPLGEVRVKHDGVSVQIFCKQRFKDIESNVNS